MLTPLQQRLLDIVGRLPEADGFALAGGAALIVRGKVDRDLRVVLSPLEEPAADKIGPSGVS